MAINKPKDIEELKALIRETYKRYVGKKDGEKATILDVAKLFNVPIDESRLGDYTVREIDFSIPFIEIMDEGKYIFYSATFTRSVELLNVYGPMLNSVVSVSPIRKVESLYNIGSSVPIITRMTFVKDEYELTFEREEANDIRRGSDGETMTVSVSRPAGSDGTSLKQVLFSKIYKTGFNNEQIGDTIEHEYTYDSDYFIRSENVLNRSTYVKNKNIIVKINRIKQEGLYKYFSGACFESTNVPVGKYLPSNILAVYKKEYPLLLNSNAKSAIVFQFFTEDRIHHSLQVYKGHKFIKTMYEAYRDCYSEEETKGTIASLNTSLPILTVGTITSEEIQSVIHYLKEKFSGTMFLGAVFNELNAFRTKIDIKNGVIQETTDPLSPKLFIDKSFDDICDVVSPDIDDYFEEILKQFYEATHMKETLEIDKSNVIRPVDD